MDSIAKKIDKNISERIRMIRFPLIVGIIFIHSYGYQASFSDGVHGIKQINQIGLFLQILFSQVLGRISVPLFYLISGYLFFQNFDGSKKVYINKINKRISTLLAPYLFWNISLLLVHILFQNISFTETFFNPGKKPILSYSAIEYVRAIFGIGRPPISYQFWFIRDLMLLVLFAPVIFILVRHLPKLSFFLLFLIWFFNINSIIDNEAIFFFFSGCAICVNGIPTTQLDSYHWKLTLIFLSCALFDSYNVMSHSMIPPADSYFHKLFILLGILWIWSMTNEFTQTLVSKRLQSISYISFFVFAFHEPLVTALKKLSIMMFKPQETFIITLIYFLVPISATIISICVGVLLRKMFPGLYRTATGNR